jgi:23S rRNA (uracil1939-C5)-methyltransferase
MMGRSRRNRPFYENVEVIDVAAEGNAIAKVDDVVIFIKNVVPGDIVDIQVTKKRKRYREARVVNFKNYSPDRVTPFCKHFGVCGGCKWQNLPYEKQLFYKQKQVVDQLKRIGKIELPEILPIIGASHTTFYRNKLEFTFCSQRWLTFEESNNSEEKKSEGALGFHIPGLFDKVLNIDEASYQIQFLTGFGNTR